MVVCKFYASGRCKFGSNCRFEHPRADYYQPNYYSGYYGQQSSGNRYEALSPPRYNQSPPPSYTVNRQQQDQNDNSLHCAVITELDQWEKGKQWPLSCFAPLKGSCLPDFVDLSPEELRHYYYEAQKHNTLDKYMIGLKIIFQEAEQQKKKVRQPAYRSIVNQLMSGRTFPPPKDPVNLLIPQSGTTSSSSTGSSSIFGGAASGSVFGGSSSTGGGNTNALGGSGSGIFGGGSGASTTSIFGAGGSSGTAATSSLFGGGTSGGSVGQNLFGKSSTPTAPAAAAASSFSFKLSDQQPNTTSSPFGSPQGSFTTQPHASPQPQPSFPFGQPKPAVAEAAKSFSFASQPNASVVQPSSPGGMGQQSLFGKAPPQGTLVSPGAPLQAGLFGKPAAGVLAGQISNIPIFTPLEELVPEEKEQFEATSFTLGKIPIRAPPREVCG